MLGKDQGRLFDRDDQPLDSGIIVFRLKALLRSNVNWQEFNKPLNFPTYPSQEAMNRPLVNFLRLSTRVRISSF